MNEQERSQKFRIAYQKLIAEYGFQVTPVIENRQYGNAVMVEPVAHILPIPNWQPPPVTEEAPVKPDKTPKSDK